MRKGKFLISILSLAAACCIGLTGCAESEARGIASIKKTASNGLVDTYTVYYTDGSTDSFEITNGADGNDGADGQNGRDGQDLTAEEVYEKYIAEYGTIPYSDFLSLYLSFGTDDYSVVNKCLRSSAKVYTEFTETTSIPKPGGTTSTSQQTIYTGSAVVYEMDEDYTYFITNYHVVYNSSSTTGISEIIHCYLYGSEGIPSSTSSNSYDYGNYAIACEFIGGSVTYDLAVLRAETEAVKAINEDVCAVQLADGYSVGQTAIAIGNPEDEGISVTKGIVSVDNDYISLNIDGTARTYRSIRIDTALYSGNSGGGLFNAYGQLIGINNAGNVEEQNINYAIPLQIVEGAVENILRSHADGDDDTIGVRKITIGVTVTAQNSRYVYDKSVGSGKIVEDILITAISDSSIAQAIGLQENDLLRSIEIDGKSYALDRYFELGDHLFWITENTVLRFTYKRDGEVYDTASYTVLASDLAAVA